MPNLGLHQKTHLSTQRKISLGSWRTTYDPKMYGVLDVRVERALEYINLFRGATGKHITMSHLCARAAAEALAQNPDANAVLRWNRIYLRETIAVFFQIAISREGQQGPDLSGSTIYDAHKKSLSQICDEADAKIAAVRSEQDQVSEQSRRFADRMPEWLMRPAMRMFAFLHTTLNLDLSAFGMPNDPFGSVMITNVGSLGLQAAYAPLAPCTGVPFVLVIGAIEDRPVVNRRDASQGRGFHGGLELPIEPLVGQTYAQSARASIITTVSQWYMEQVMTDAIVPYFSDKQRPPTARAVLTALGRTSSAFEKLFDQLQEEHPDITRAYRYYADAKGWLLKVTRKSHTVFWLSVGAGRFRVTFYFPERLTGALLASELSEERKAPLRKPASGKLRSVSITFGPQRGLRDVMTLVALKRTLA